MSLNGEQSSAPRRVVEQLDRYRWRTGKLPATISDAATWFLSHAQGQQLSENTIKSYRNAINSVGLVLAELTDTPANELPISLLNRNDLGDAFNEYAMDHSAASQQQRRSTWNSLCQLLVDYDILEKNPMEQVAKVKITDREAPKALSNADVEQLLKTVEDPEKFFHGRQSDSRRWREIDHAMILLLLITAIRESELCGINFGDISASYDDTGACSLQIRGKGNRKRTQYIEANVVAVLTTYLESRRERFPGTARQAKGVWKAWGVDQPLFVGNDGERITQATLYYRVKAAFQQAGLSDSRTPGALVHQLRHTVATMLANDPSVTVHELKNMLGHASLNSTLRYTDGAGRETRRVAKRNPVYAAIQKPPMEVF